MLYSPAAHWGRPRLHPHVLNVLGMQMELLKLDGWTGGQTDGRRVIQYPPSAINCDRGQKTSSMGCIDILLDGQAP